MCLTSGYHQQQTDKDTVSLKGWLCCGSVVDGKVWLNFNILDICGWHLVSHNGVDLLCMNDCAVADDGSH